MRNVPVALVALVAAAPLFAQAPAGWKMRVDASESAADPDAPGMAQLVKEGSGFHAINPKAAVYWNPGHTNYYGLVFGGSKLEGAEQAYIYFVVAQNGSWLIKRREGATSPTVAPKTPADIVKKPDADGKSTNTLEVRVSTDKIDFVVNGTVVHTEAKTGPLAKTDGIWGIRVNHLLDVNIADLGVSK